MSDKPSLYVVERKEVIILVVLFVLVTVLSFTMGVRYGESVGKKSAKQFAAAEREQNHDEENPVGGSLGEAGAQAPAPAAAGHDAHETKVEAKAEAHGEAHDSHAVPAPAPTNDSHAAKSVSPEEAAKEEAPAKLSSQVKDAVEKNSDEFLLNALKESGVEPPGGKAPQEAKLPQATKRARSGIYVIQVGSHPTRGEAESQVRNLKSKRLEAEILAPFKDRQGEWHRVVLGSYKTKRDAEKDAKVYKSKGTIISYFVWRLP